MIEEKPLKKTHLLAALSEVKDKYFTIEDIAAEEQAVSFHPHRMTAGQQALFSDFLEAFYVQRAIDLKTMKVTETGEALVSAMPGPRCPCPNP